MSLFADHIPLLRPWLEEAEVAAAREVILSGWVSQGPKVAEFEQAIADFIGARHAVATNAATSALHLSLEVSGIGAEDEVICPATTCMSTANAICHAGAVPVFADIEPDTFNLDPEQVRNLVGEKTRAIMVVHQIGLAARIDEFERIAAKHELRIIEDAATSLGAKFQGDYLGARGNPTCFSFHPRKMITTGEGGMMLTASREMAETARTLRSAGASISDLERHRAKGVLQQVYHHAGYNYRMTDIQAAIGLIQMTRLRSMIEQRARQARYYDEGLKNLDEVQPPYCPADMVHCYSSYCIKFRSTKNRGLDDIIQTMADNNISCRRGIPPLYQEPYFRSRHPDMFLPVSEDVAKNTMFLPIFPGLTEAEQDRVIAALKQALA